MIQTLKENPTKIEETLDLIEKSFNYSPENSFGTDFHPLMEKKNHDNNYLLIQDDELIGHIGVLIKQIKIQEEVFSVPMLGGIALKEESRGRGHFSNFLQSVLEKYTDSPFFLLWSDKLELYERFKFYPAIEQFEYTGGVESDNPEYTKMKLAELSDEDLKQLETIYNQSQESRFKRSFADWENLKNISSSDIYIKRQSENIYNYFFMNKGEDLTGVIYEYGHIEDIEEISTYGVLWSPQLFEVENEENLSLLYAALLRVNNIEHFKNFVTAYTDKRISNIEILNDDILFDFEERRLQLTIKEFLVGILGPNKFVELQDSPKILISGLDSI